MKSGPVGLISEKNILIANSRYKIHQILAPGTFPFCQVTRTPYFDRIFSFVVNRKILK